MDTPFSDSPRPATSRGHHAVRGVHRDRLRTQRLQDHGNDHRGRGARPGARRRAGRTFVLRSAWTLSIGCFTFADGRSATRSRREPSRWEPRCAAPLSSCPCPLLHVADRLGPRRARPRERHRPTHLYRPAAARRCGLTRGRADGHRLPTPQGTADEDLVAVGGARPPRATRPAAAVTSRVKPDRPEADALCRPNEGETPR